MERGPKGHNDGREAFKLKYPQLIKIFPASQVMAKSDERDTTRGV